MKILLGSQTFHGQSGGAVGQRLVNMYARKNPEGSKYPFTLRGTAGLKLWLDLETDAGVQGMQKMGGDLYAFSDGGAIKIDVDKNATVLSGSLTGSQGMLDLDNNGTQMVAVTPDEEGFIIDSTSVTKITDSDFPGASSVTFMDGSHIFTRPDTAQFFIPEALYDASAYDAADFATAEKGGPGNLVRGKAFNSGLWLFKERGFQVNYNSGNADFPFEYLQGTANTTCGLGAKFSVAQADNGMFFLGSDRMVYRIEGYKPVVISTDAVAEAIEGYSIVSDAFGFIYTENNHKFYVLTFPAGDATWVYDIATGLWHERKSFGLGRWRPNCFEHFAGKNLVGDFNSGKIYELSLTTYDEAGEPLEAIIEGAPVWGDDARITHDRVFLDIKAGVGLNSGQGSDPQVMMRYSDDGGEGWSNERWKSFGMVGKRKVRPVWRRNGQARQRIYQFKITDPVERVINGAYIGARGGKE